MIIQVCVLNRESPDKSEMIIKALDRLKKSGRHSTAEWCADTFQIVGDYLEVEGWAIESGSQQNDHFWLNGVNVTDSVVYEEREDIDKLMPQFKKSRPRGFLIRSNVAPIDGQFWRLSYGSRDDSLGIHSYYVPCDGHGVDVALPWPEANRRFRVHGSEEFEPFILEGYSAAKKICSILEHYTKLDLSKVKLLDWGCGCGRVNRWLVDVFEELWGVDIDEDNVSWCRSHLPHSDHWSGISLAPPTHFADKSFDVVIGVSVFTHLNEVSQIEWLAELMRIVRPGGYALVTVHGTSSSHRFGLDPRTMNEWQKKGFMDLGPSLDLEEVFGYTEDYRGSLHTSAYIKKIWAKYAHIVKILPSVIGNHQDVILLQKL